MSTNLIEKYRSPNQHAWSKFLKNKPALFGLGWIVISVVIALLGYLISPDLASDPYFLITVILCSFWA